MIDGVIKYLPSPIEPVKTTEGEEILPEKKNKLCALAFKVVNDKEKGLITFFRVYSGILKNRQKIMNSNLNTIERISSLMRVRADEM